MGQRAAGDLPQGWRPLREPRPEGAAATPAVTPFMRLARAHALGVAGDTLIALALAGSLFFSIDPDAARWRVALYLVLTMAPFAIVSPFIGPLIDRAAGGRRLMVVLSAALRAVICLFMARHHESLWLFPEAFAALALSKGYHVAKNALVPTLVPGDEGLVEANSKLVLVSGVVGFVAAVPGGLLGWLAGPGWVLGLGAACFAAATVLAAQMPATTVAPSAPKPEEVAELRTLGIVLAASAMALLRGAVGFLTFLIAFGFRREDLAAAWFGVAIGASGLGSLLGAGVAPALRRRVPEESILIGVLVASAGVAVVATQLGTIPAAAAMAGALGLASSAGKLAFDAIVQRDAPDANRGRSIARFETRFQLVWVSAAFLPVLLPIPMWVGHLVLALGTGAAALTYLNRLKFVRRTGRLPERKALRLPPAVAGRLPRPAVTGKLRLRRATDPTEVLPPAPVAEPPMEPPTEALPLEPGEDGTAPLPLEWPGERGPER